MYVSREGDQVKYGLQPDDSQQLRDIIEHLVPEWALLFARKNAEYGGGDDGNASVLGIKGQYADIWRKMSKLKRAMWDDEKLEFEKTEEVISDLIGHLFLTLQMMRVKDEADRLYAYTEDDAAVDAFFRMTGGDPRAALNMSHLLNPPFRELVAARATQMLEEQQSEAEHAASLGDGEDVPRRASVILHEVVAGMRRDGATRREAYEGARLIGAADGSPGEASLRALSENGAYGFKVRNDGADGFASEEFAEGDFLQHHNHYPYSAELKVGPARVVTEQVDGKVRYYHEAYPGADREPLALVPKALIERAQKDQHVMAKEQEAGLNTLASWLDRS